MFLPVPAHPGCLGQIPQSRKTVVCVCVNMIATTKKHYKLRYEENRKKINYNNLTKLNRNTYNRSTLSCLKLYGTFFNNNT